MFTSCANPDCRVTYTEGGKFFRFRLDPGPKQVAVNAHSVQHFWLCRACSKLYTLECRRANCIVIRPRLLQSPLKGLARTIGPIG